MDVKGKITIFPRKIKVEEETKTIFNGTISTKVTEENGEERRINKSVEVRFSSKKFPEDKLNLMDEEKCYVLQIDNGFLGVREAKDSRELYIMVTDGTLLDSKKVERKEKVVAPKSDDLPF